MSQVNNLPTNPFKDCKSVTVESQIIIQLESLLDICDCCLNHHTPTTPQEVQALMWRVRLLSESTLLKFNHYSGIDPIA
jgi:hypothetical protein